MDEAVEVTTATAEDGHLEGIEREVGTQRGRDPPAHDAATEGVDDEGRIAEAAWGPDIGEVGHPETVGSVRAEGAMHEVGGSLALGCRVRGAHLLRARDTAETELVHEAPDLVSADVELLPPQLVPHLAHAIDLEVLGVDPLDLGFQLRILQ